MRMSALLVVALAMMACKEPAPVGVDDAPAVKLGGIEEGAIQLGDDRVELVRTFRLGEVEGLYCLVMQVQGVVPTDHRDYGAGSYRDGVELNGERLVELNSLVPDEGGPYQVMVEVDADRLREGENEIRVVAGKHEAEGKVNFDDFQWGPARMVRGSRVRVAVEENGVAIPARIQVLDPEGKRLSFGPRYRAGGAAHVMATLDGKAEMVLPRGEVFEIWGSRGMEYTADSRKVVPSQEVEEVSLFLTRAIETRGWIAGDFHLHADPSGDSRVPLRDRIVSCLAEGLEFAVATDHNRITDYGPVAREMGVDGMLLTCVGDEVTTGNPNLGHFNPFPLKTGMPPVKFRETDPAEMFEIARKEHGARVIQVNHPRSGNIGYFNLFDLDRETGRGRKEGYSPDFDAVEVFNGLTSMEEVGQVLEDWYAILRSGIRIVATGTSDSHTIVWQDPGVARSYVFVGEDFVGDVTVEDVCDAVKAGRVVVTSGPMLHVTANGRGLGEEVAAPGGRVEVFVRVSAAPWVRVDTLDILVGGKVAKTVPIPDDESPIRFEYAVPVNVEADTFIIVIARGPGYRAPILTNGRVTPLAFSNPIWIRMEGCK